MELELIINDLIVYLNKKNKLESLREIVVPKFMHKEMVNYGTILRTVKVTVGENFELRFK